MKLALINTALISANSKIFYIFDYQKLKPNKMTKSITVFSFLCLICSTKLFSQNKTTSNKSNANEISFSLLESGGPSWVFNLQTNFADSVLVQIQDDSRSIFNSEKYFLSENLISKFSVYGLPTNEFYFVLIKQDEEIFREKLYLNN